jgi:predicted nucleotidyltransferase
MSTCVDKCHQIKKLLSILTETLGFEVPAEEILDSKETVDNSILDDPQKNLNPELWVDIESSELPRLNDKLRNQIISFAKRKAEEVGVRIKYLLMFGGSASYQYTDKSDIDCVIYAKSVKQEEYEALRKHFKDETSNFGEHVITLYLKPQTDRPLEISDAVYDVLNNSWIVPPLVLPQHFDPDVFFAPLIKEAERRARSFDLKFAKLLRLQADISDKKNALKLNPQDPVRIKRDIKDLKDDQILLIEDLVDQFHMIHEQRHELHRKLEQKVLQGETLSRFARFQSPEILWKYLDKHHYLDSLKKLETWLENHYEKKILQKEETKNSGDN